MTYTLKSLRPGDLMIGPIDGFIPGAFPVGAGQFVVAPWKHRLTYRTWRRWRHAATVVRAATPDYARGAFTDAVGHGPFIGQAMPSGFETVEIGAEHWTPDFMFIRPRYSPGQGMAVALHAEEMTERKIPYGWLDYVRIAAHRTPIPTPHLDRHVSAVDEDGYPLRAICSQAVDAQLTMAGFEVFDDGRRPQDVIPSELGLRLLDLGPELVIRPGVVDGNPDQPAVRRGLLA